jgi:hypothetical protein
MPCSPLIVPPSAMHASRISVPADRDGVDLRAFAPVEDQQRVQVAVARVEDVADRQIVSRAISSTRVQRLRQRVRGTVAS